MEDSKDKKIEKALRKVLDEKISTEDILKIDALTPKVTRYVVRMKRTKKEVRDKFKDEEKHILELVINNLEEASFLNDEEYADTYVKNALITKTNSVFELKMKMQKKGVPKEYISRAFSKYSDELKKYEINNIMKTFERRKRDDFQKVLNYIYRKGYKKENISIAQEEYRYKHNM